jgi:diguanylate cyclase (GGDEF)-like protein
MEADLSSPSPAAPHQGSNNVPPTDVAPRFGPPFATTMGTAAAIVSMIELLLPGAEVVIEWETPTGLEGCLNGANRVWSAHAVRATADAVILCDQDGERLGTLRVVGPDGEPPSEEIARVAHGLGRLLAGHLTDQRAARDLRKLASTDPLTGLLNRRAFMTRLREEWGAGRGTAATSSLLLADVDGLKPANDRHGHAVGDTLLRDVAASLRAGGRPKDCFGRLGGDEFAALLIDDGDGDRADAFAAHFQECLAAAQQDRPARLSVSLGYAPIAVASSPEAALEAADRKLYTAKAAARGD